MANTIAVAQDHPISPKAAHVGMVRVSVSSTDAYAAASGGFTIDFSTILTSLGIQPSDLLSVDGNGTTATGHVVTAVRSATAGQWTVRLWNGTAQIADGAMTQTLPIRLWFSQGAKP